MTPLLKLVLMANLGPSGELYRQGAILINSRGSRFCDEQQDTDQVAFQEGGKAYVVFDESISRSFNGDPYYISTAPGIAFATFNDYRRGRPEVLHSARGPEELARALGMPPDNLRAAIDSSKLHTQGECLFAMGPIRATLTVTEGGFAVDERFRVLDESRSAIPRLYAVGGTGHGGLTLRGHGLRLAWAFTSGRLAGASAAAESPLGMKVAWLSGDRQ
jgi:fumarate reductase flavoprotein subunit